VGYREMACEGLESVDEVVVLWSMTPCGFIGG
jgi:hypothetical protein